jgi:ABC-type multidrug transport system permease subunit
MTTMKGGTGRASLLVAVLAAALAIVGLALRFANDSEDVLFIVALVCVVATFVGAAAVALGIIALAQRQRPRSDAVVGLIVGAIPPLLFLVGQFFAFLSMLSQPRGG